MSQAMAKLFKIIGETFSAGQRKGYEKAVTRVVAALDSGKLKSTDKATLATPSSMQDSPDGYHLLMA
jgi:hypothetical protein